MDENEVSINEIETPIYDALASDDLNEKNLEVDDLLEEEVRPADVIFKHPHQILTNKQIQLLFRKQAWLAKEKAALKERGEDEETAEELTPTEKSAIDLFILRARGQHSKAKVLTAKDRTARKAKRRISKQSRKANR
jgi:hypothetical protein